MVLPRCSGSTEYWHDSGECTDSCKPTPRTQLTTFDPSCDTRLQEVSAKIKAARLVLSDNDVVEQAVKQLIDCTCSMPVKDFPNVTLAFGTEALPLASVWIVLKTETRKFHLLQIFPNF